MLILTRKNDQYVFAYDLKTHAIVGKVTVLPFRGSTLKARVRLEFPANVGFIRHELTQFRGASVDELKAIPLGVILEIYHNLDTNG